jgi:peptidoglycan/LPS O-acetylase OafA/YrhL
MVQNWGFTHALSWNHPAWSISTELAAYLLFPLMVIVAPITRAPRYVLVCGIGAAIAIMASWLYLAGSDDLGEDIPHFGLVRCLFEFVAGCMLCALWLKSEGAGRREYGAFAILAVAAGFAWTLDGRNELWAFPAIAACAIFAIAQTWRNPIFQAAMRPLVWLGEISYATYLSHFMLFIWFKIALVQDAANISSTLIMLYLLLTLIVSGVLHHIIEKPGRRLAHRRAPSRNFVGTAA